MKLLIVDTETTGTSDTDDVCEIAVTLYQIGKTERATGAIASLTTLIPVTTNPAESINGISPELSQIAQDNASQVLSLMQRISWFGDYAVAFNAEFDAPFVDKILGKQKWLCAMKDFDWRYPNPNKYGAFKLTDLALWMGIGVSTVHRAGDDVRLLVECFNRRRGLLNRMVERAIFVANSPLVEIRACVSYDNRELAKNAGFRWDAETRSWLRTMRNAQVEPFITELPFKVEICEEEDRDI